MSVPYRKGTLISVPAVHYRAVFAARVNAICRNEKSRPDAIAVELGASAVQSAVQWLRELKVDQGEPLPIMLGLLWRNLYIHPKYRGTAIHLQKDFALPIDKIPGKVLNEALNYSPYNLLCLSPTDSLIEAIRCSLELQIPVYGVDLEEMSSHETDQYICEDPLAAREDMDGYIQRNQGPASRCRDRYLDSRREWVMAARIKHLMERYERVLFTGGLAHWTRIKGLLNNPYHPAAVGLPKPGTLEINRILVSPSRAVSQMDIYPNVTTHYQTHRKVANQISGLPKAINYESIVRGQLDTTYEKYLSCNDHKAGEKKTDLLKLTKFEDFLVRFCVVNHCLLPHTHLLLTAATATMPEPFCKILQESVLYHEMEWVDHKIFPELPELNENRGASKKAVLDIPESASFFVADALSNPSGSGRKMTSCTLLPPIGENTRNTHYLNRTDNRSYTSWVWPPCEYICYSTALEAARIYKEKQTKHKTQEFEGSLLGGVDVRSTLRAQIRDNDTLYVKEPPADIEHLIAGGHAIEPSVFIFENLEQNIEGKWRLGSAGAPLNEFVSHEERPRFNHIERTQGSVFVSWVNFSSEMVVPRCFDHTITSLDKLNGIVMFGNPAANLKQSARWLKETRYKTCPILQGSGMSALFEFYQSRFGLDLKKQGLSRASALMLMGVPYAQKRLILVGPDDFKISSFVQRQADVRKISIDFVPLSALSGSHISKMRHQYMVKTGKGGELIPPEMEKILGSKEAFLDRLPQAMQQQGR